MMSAFKDTSHFLRHDGSGKSSFFLKYSIACARLEPLVPRQLLFVLILAALLICSCSEQIDVDLAGFNDESQACLECHQVDLDKDHRLDCLNCHIVSEVATGLPEDHKLVSTSPAHPDLAATACGTCHKDQVEMVKNNDHYLLRGHITLVRQAFGVDAELLSDDDRSFVRPAAHARPNSTTQLVDDLLARRCLRCHVYTRGDEFSSVSRGTGCAACHLSFDQGQLSSHRFDAPPPDDRCLSCHYGNHVGFDYHGRFEHDLNEEYRTPYMVSLTEPRPFGVEYQLLSADVHQQAGIVCVDCHGANQVMADGEALLCNDCHDYNEAENEPAPLTKEGDKVVFSSSARGNRHVVPQLSHPAHSRYGDRFSCQACHASWSFNDTPTHLLRIDHEEFDDFYKLSLDGSSEVLEILASHILEDGDLLEPRMSDKFTGVDVEGIWFRGFGERRWEQVLLAPDSQGVITTVRPNLDLRLSWIDEDEESRYDNLEPVAGFQRSRPYAPHTIGKAGLFYENRIRPFLTGQSSN